MNKYLLLWLEGPLQSWGADSKFDRRDTLPFPTKSGVLGLILCAMGASGEQKELLAQMAPFKQTVVAYTRTRKDSKDSLVKIERPPLLRDFHMVGAGYESDPKKNPWQALMEPYKSNGKRRTSEGGGAKMTYRYYLQDAVFAVVLEAPSDLAQTFADVLKSPVYSIYLGRKNCVPSEFIYQGIFDSQESALDHAGSIMQEKELMVDFQVFDGEHTGVPMSLNDVPVQFGPIKKYRDRRVTMVKDQ